MRVLRVVEYIGPHLLDPSIPLAEVGGGWMPAWGAVLALFGFVCGVLALEVIRLRGVRSRRGRHVG